MPTMFPNPKMATNYKTVLCKFWLETGTCKFSENCSYAHGGPEIRTAIDNASLLASQQVPFAQQFDPLKNPMFEKAIRFHQLAGICDKLKKLHKNDEETIEKIYAAEKFLL